MDPRTVVRPFYEQCLTVSSSADASQVGRVMGELLAPDFQSKNAAETKGKAQLVGQVQAFWKMVPDLKWHIEEMLQDGQRVVVRSTATGTPKAGEFMGVPVDGKRSFKIMTIDIHTVVGQQITEVFHLEEWGTAMRQLKGA
ncbi:MAG: ester cyclase [Myxococcaceae bacterium]